MDAETKYVRPRNSLHLYQSVTAALLRNTLRSDKTAVVESTIENIVSRLLVTLLSIDNAPPVHRTKNKSFWENNAYTTQKPYITTFPDVHGGFMLQILLQFKNEPEYAEMEALYSRLELPGSFEWKKKHEPNKTLKELLRQGNRTLSHFLFSNNIDEEDVATTHILAETIFASRVRFLREFIDKVVTFIEQSVMEPTEELFYGTSTAKNIGFTQQVCDGFQDILLFMFHTLFEYHQNINLIQESTNNVLTKMAVQDGQTIHERRTQSNGSPTIVDRIFHKERNTMLYDFTCNICSPFLRQDRLPAGSQVVIGPTIENSNDMAGSIRMATYACRAFELGMKLVVADKKAVFIHDSYLSEIANESIVPSPRNSLKAELYSPPSDDAMFKNVTARYRGYFVMQQSILVSQLCSILESEVDRQCQALLQRRGAPSIAHLIDDFNQQL